ncbi:MAG TPA: ferritin-like domain-containing protein [Candidatus Polarisedimenticolia bacterium]|jgi:ferritin-like metal-binding protein YciE|nr:ferritin-like domain-containing protein [Candidatus Polarisedimenticolia bacterium]
MELATLEALYVEQLKDLYSAEKQILKALPKMIKAAGHQKLKEAFSAHERQTQTHVERLEQIFKGLEVSPKGKKCVGMEGLLKEGAELIQEDPEPGVLDAGLISAAQHVEHYEMAGYGTVRTWARLLTFEDQAELLQQTLDEEGDTDKILTELAETSVNVDADLQPQMTARTAERHRM